MHALTRIVQVLTGAALAGVVASMAFSSGQPEGVAAAISRRNKAFGRPQSFVAGAPVNGVQFMVKDALTYASTGGWGFSQFDDGKPASAAMLASCFPCHQSPKERDRVFTRYAP